MWRICLALCKSFVQASRLSSSTSPNRWIPWLSSWIKWGMDMVQRTTRPSMSRIVDILQQLAMLIAWRERSSRGRFREWFHRWVTLSCNPCKIDRGRRDEWIRLGGSTNKGRKVGQMSEMKRTSYTEETMCTWDSIHHQRNQSGKAVRIEDLGQHQACRSLINKKECSLLDVD